jgi:Ras-related protein Rab-1A
MNYLFKICLVGNSGTGKTTFIESLVKNFYYESKEKTVGIDFFTYIIDDIKFQVWDTSGNIMFLGIVRSYFNDASGILLFFSDKKSFDNIDYWIGEIRKINQKCKIILIQSASEYNLDYIGEDEIHLKCDKNVIDKFIKIDSKYMKNIEIVLPEMAKLLVHKKAVSFNNTTDYIKMDGDGDGDGDSGGLKNLCDKCIVL